MASIYDLYIEQGSAFSQSLDITGDKTGYTIGMSIKDSEGTLTTGYASWTDDSAGQFDITVTSSQSASLSSGRGVYDIEITDGSGNVDRILQGRVYVDGEVK